MEMYRGINLSITNDLFNGQLLSKTPAQYDFVKHGIEKELKSSYLRTERGSIIDARSLETSWMPKIEAQVFISHSHLDNTGEQTIIKQIAWCLEQLGISYFVDSFVWDYADDLLKMIDKQFCKSGPTTYSYEKRNVSTAHVHNMLNMALLKMMDACECFLFVNTSNSIPQSDLLTQEDIDNPTYSPWLYSELTSSSLIRKRPLEEHRLSMLKEGKIINHSKQVVPMVYPAPLDHLVSLSQDEFEKWAFSMLKHGTHGESALDKLYKLK